MSLVHKLPSEPAVLVFELTRCSFHIVTSQQSCKEALFARTATSAGTAQLTVRGCSASRPFARPRGDQATAMGPTSSSQRWQDLSAKDKNKQSIHRKSYRATSTGISLKCLYLFCDFQLVPLQSGRGTFKLRLGAVESRLWATGRSAEIMETKRGLWKQRGCSS